MVDEFPSRILTHYTSGGGLLGIFENKAIWASRIQFLNDYMEFRLAKELAQTAIASYNLPNQNISLIQLCNAVSNYIGRIDPVLYVASFSEDGDSLSQWRAYCPANLGYNIGFNADKLTLLAEKQGFYLRPCIYDFETQKTMINEWIDRLLKDFISRFPTSSNAVQFCQDNMNPYVNGFILNAPYFKHPAFKEECEWRLVSKMPPNDRHAKLRVGKSTLIPYIPFSIPFDTDETPLYNITIGPTPNPELAQDSIHYLLRGLPSSAHWRVSRAPYRNW